MNTKYKTPPVAAFLLVVGPLVGGFIGYAMAYKPEPPPPAPPPAPTVECRCKCEVDCCPDPLPHDWED